MNSVTYHPSNQSDSVQNITSEGLKEPKLKWMSYDTGNVWADFFGGGGGGGCDPGLVSEVLATFVLCFLFFSNIKKGVKGSS